MADLKLSAIFSAAVSIASIKCKSNSKVIIFSDKSPSYVKERLAELPLLKKTMTFFFQSVLSLSPLKRV